MTLDTPIVEEVDIQEVDCFTKTMEIYFDAKDPFHIVLEFRIFNIHENDKEDQDFFGKFDFDEEIEVAHLQYVDKNMKNEPFVDIEDYVTRSQYEQIMNRIHAEAQAYMEERSK